MELLLGCGCSGGRFHAPIFPITKILLLSVLSTSFDTVGAGSYQLRGVRGLIPMEGAERISWVSGFCSGWLDAHFGWTFLVIVAIAFFALQSLLQTHHQADRHGTQPDRR